MKVAVAADHGGFDQKQELVQYMLDMGLEVEDMGACNCDAVDYPDYALPVALAVAEGRVDRGVLVCGTGLGMAIAANKIPGIRATNVITPGFARLAREHNNANILTLSGRHIDLETNKELVSIFFETVFDEGHHIPRLEKIAKMEKLTF